MVVRLDIRRSTGCRLILSAVPAPEVLFAGLRGGSSARPRPPALLSGGVMEWMMCSFSIGYVGVGLPLPLRSSHSYA